MQATQPEELLCRTMAGTALDPCYCRHTRKFAAGFMFADGLPSAYFGCKWFHKELSQLQQAAATQRQPGVLPL